MLERMSRKLSGSIATAARSAATRIAGHVVGEEILDDRQPVGGAQRAERRDRFEADVRRRLRLGGEADQRPDRAAVADQRQGPFRRHQHFRRSPLRAEDRDERDPRRRWPWSRQGRAPRRPACICPARAAARGARAARADRRCARARRRPATTSSRGGRRRRGRRRPAARTRQAARARRSPGETPRSPERPAISRRRAARPSPQDCARTRPPCGRWPRPLPWRRSGRAPRRRGRARWATRRPAPRRAPAPQTRRR